MIKAAVSSETLVTSLHGLTTRKNPILTSNDQEQINLPPLKNINSVQVERTVPNFGTAMREPTEMFGPSVSK
jgi:hypothetical protein